MPKKKNVRTARSAAEHAPPRAYASRQAFSPARLLQLGLGFWGPRALLSAVELGVFSILARVRSMSRNCVSG
jgi:hypothetical protein